MRRTLVPAIVLLLAVAPAAPAQQDAIERVQPIVAAGLSCAAGGWSVAGYSATGAPGSWTVHVSLAHPGADFRIVADFLVPEGAAIEPKDKLAEDILACAGGGDIPVPVVRAFAEKGAVQPGETVGLAFAIEDESGRAKVRLNLYEGGAWIKRWTRTVKARSLDHRYEAEVAIPDSLEGPLHFCVWADNAAGGRSRKAPRSACARIALVVDIRKVSNGCGGKGWDSVVAVENYFGNTATFSDEATGKSYEVNFKPACDVHDAGYGGQTIRDPINGNRLVDFQGWTRKQVDDKFRKDMITLCNRDIPDPEAVAARQACYDNYRYSFVRSFGQMFFDANTMKEGHQAVGPRE